jgi:hypothetical protein
MYHNSGFSFKMQYVEDKKEATELKVPSGWQFCGRYHDLVKP